MMTLLSGHSLTGITQFEPESMALNLTERQSTATITLGEEAPAIGVGDWLRDETEPGAGIVWRVKTVDTQYERKTRTIQLEHAINTLRDTLMFGEVTPKTITGNTSATNCTAEEAITYILNQQSDWVLGTCGYSASNPYNFNGDDLFSALETVSSSLEDCWWSYDLTVYPFEITISPKSTAVSTELRMSRNIQTARMTVDRSRMYTRLYPIGKNNLHIDGDYVSVNEEIYGTISKTETDQSISTKEELERWAEERIAKHCEPLVTVTVSVLDLSEATGETLDHIVLGAKCRMPLEEYNVTIEETITKISYGDKIAEPEKGTVTLANVQEDVASIINQLIKSGTKGTKTHAKNGEEDHAWMIDTNDHIGLIAEGIAGEGAAQDWSRVAELLVDGNGIHQRVTEAQGDIINAYSLIDQTTTAIRLEIGTVASEVRSFIQQTPEMIHAEVGYAVSGLAHSVIEQTATYIRSEVSNAASAISQSVIEQTTEYVRTEVSNVASGVAWSVVTQTMTNITQEVARKSKVYMQWTNPNDGVNVLHEGDIWIKADVNKTWGANSTYSWDSQASKQWKSKYGDLYHVWKNGMWILSVDTSRDVENSVTIEHTDKLYAIDAKAKNLEGEEFRGRLEVTAREINSSVSTAKSQIYSAIQQTATNIRAVVANEVAGLQSSIEQTAESITSSVSAAKSQLYSTIQQTATNIRAEVVNIRDGLQSSIEQTASSITTSVSAAKSAMYSTIMQTATNIRAVVANEVAGLQSSIEQTASSITTSVSAAKSAMYSVIEQTATQIRAEVANTASSLRSSITQQANRISLLVEGTGSNAHIKPAEIVAAINNGSSSIKISANHITLDGDTVVGLLEGKAIGANSFMGETFYVIGGGQIILGEDSTIGDADSAGLIVDASVSGNTLTLTRYDGDTINFSKAVTSVDWDWSNGTLTVTPQPMDTDFVLGSIVQAAKSQSGKTYTVPIKFEYGSQGQYSTTIKDVSISVNYTPTVYTVWTHDAPSTPSGYSKASNGYYIKGSGSSAEIMIYTYGVMTVDGNTINGNDYSLYNPLATMPTNIYRDGYSSGYSSGRSSISSSDITDYDIYTHDAPSTPSGYTKSSHGYYIKNAGTASAEVRIYTYAEMTVNGKLLNSSGASLYDYLSVMPTYVYGDGFSAGTAYGYDANHNLFIGDANYAAMSSEINVTPGSPVEVWPYFMSYDGQSYKYGSKYTIKGVNPHPTLYSLYCTEGGQVPGQALYRYKFTYESQSSKGWNEGDSVPFYK